MREPAGLAYERVAMEEHERGVAEPFDQGLEVSGPGCGKEQV